MKPIYRKILSASVVGLALTACSTARISSDNGVSENNTGAAGVNAGEASNALGAGGPGGTGTASSVMTPATAASNSRQQ